MKNLYKHLQNIEEAAQGNEKLDVLKLAMRDDVDVIEYLRLVFCDNVYGVSIRTIEKAVNYNKKLDGTYSDIGECVFDKLYNTEQDDPLKPELTIEGIKDILNKILKLSGNKLTDYLREELLNREMTEAKWLVRLIVKNPACGISREGVNKILKSMNLEIIDKFGVQLCGKVADIEEWTEFPVLVEEKWDGFRCIAKKENNKITLTSRQGKDVSNFLPEIIEELQKYDKIDFIFDGEIMAKNFSAIQKRIGRKAENLEEVEDLHYRVFDVLSFQGDDMTKNTQEVRTRILLQSINESKRLRLTVFLLCDNKKVLEDFYNNVCNRKGEGVVIKKIKDPYTKDGRKSWFKVKPIIENNFKVTGYRMGSGKYKDDIGAIEVTDKNEKIISYVGSGMTIEKREELTRRMKEGTLNNTIVEVRYNEITKNQSNNYSLRFPRLLKIRDDCSEADDINNI